MLPPLRQTDRTTLRRRRQRGSYDRALVHAVLDEALVCHVAWAHEGEPMIQPMAFARVGERIYLHGSPNNRCLLALASGAPASVSVTLVDALVLAKTVGHHSLNYRAVVLCGVGERVTDPAEARAGLDAVVEKMLPGRGAHAHGVTDDDLRTTLVVSFPIDEGSAKVRSGPPGAEDDEAKGFVGVIPIRTVADPAVVAAGSVGDVPHLSRMETLREAALPDATAVLAESFRWDAATTPLGAERLARYLRVQPDGWLAAYAQGDAASAPTLIGVGGALVFGETAYLGLIGVTKAHQRKGLGRAITERLMRLCEAKGVRRVLLDASAAGAPVYVKLGFVTDDEAVIFVGTRRDGPTEGVSRATPDDLAALVALDAAAWGESREALLRATLDAGAGFVKRGADGAVEAFAVAQAGGVGPVVARTADAAGAVLDAALAACVAERPRVIARASHAGARALLEARGFREERRLLHMRLGDERAPTPDVWAQESLAGG
ncbi:MAG: GNAT family N-acetyltransferase [Polyangiales bacterium]